TERVVCFDDAFSLYKETVASSMYQSQTSSQIKLYKALPASPNAYLSVFFVTCVIVSFKRVKIHLSGACNSPVKSISSNVIPSMFNKAKREAFQILLAKFQVASTFSQWKRKSWPGDVPVNKK